jgi:hypothetical protein
MAVAKGPFNAGMFSVIQIAVFVLLLLRDPFVEETACFVGFGGLDDGGQV